MFGQHRDQLPDGFPDALFAKAAVADDQSGRCGEPLGTVVTGAVDTDGSTGRGLDDGALVHVVGQVDHQVEPCGDSVEP